jgi:squalene-associated FAD-dependent desaturase
MPRSWARPPRVAIAGGGLAGLSTACALADAGFHVSLFERRPYLGGRASSYEHPGTGEVIDNCQHVLLGCCTNLIDFYERTGVVDKIRWYDSLTFLEPGGRASVIGASRLPAPLHTMPAFLRAQCLGLADKLAISAAMTALAPAALRESSDSFLTWLRRRGQTGQAIERFWKPILVSALNEDVDRVSVAYAAQVVRESFLKSPEAGRMGVPSVPLTQLYEAAGEYIRARQGELFLRSTVASFRAHPSHVEVMTGDGERRDFEYFVLALPFDGLKKVLPDTSAASSLRAMLDQFETSPITGIHLWFDREITDLEHAVLLDRTIQWMFHKSKLIGRNKNGGSYIELVVSSSKSLVEKSKNEIVDLALKELEEFFPSVRDATLVKSTVIKEVHATYSPKPGVDLNRPRPETVWPRVFLAGDWTATGWPATMESAVRSGYLAAESVAHIGGQQESAFLVADLPASGLMRIFG